MNHWHLASRFFAAASLLALLGSRAALAQSPAPQLGKAPLKEILAALTTEEKVKLVVGMGFYPAGFPEGILPPADPADRKVPEKVPGRPHPRHCPAGHSVAHAFGWAGGRSHCSHPGRRQHPDVLRHGLPSGYAAGFELGHRAGA